MLLTGETPNRSHSQGAPLKVADFGLAVPIQPGQKLKETCGTPNYMAPERLCRRPYDEKSDIWSIGVLMYILLAGMQAHIVAYLPCAKSVWLPLFSLSMPRHECCARELERERDSVPQVALIVPAAVYVCGRVGACTLTRTNEKGSGTHDVLSGILLQAPSRSTARRMRRSACAR